MSTFCPLYYYGEWNGIHYYYGQICEDCSYTGGQDEVEHDITGACENCGGAPGGCSDPIINPGPPDKRKLHEVGQATTGSLSSHVVGKDLKQTGLRKFASSAPDPHGFVANAAHPPQVTDLGNATYQDSRGDPRFVRLLQLVVQVTLPKAVATDPDVTIALTMLVGQERLAASSDAAHPDALVRLHHYAAGYSRRYHQVKLDKRSYHVLLHKIRPDAEETD